MQCERFDKIQGRRKVRKSGVHVILGGDNVSPLVEIGLTDLSKVKLSKKELEFFIMTFMEMKTLQP